MTLEFITKRIREQREYIAKLHERPESKAEVLKSAHDILDYLKEELEKHTGWTAARENRSPELI